MANTQKLSDIQIECLAEQVRQVILYGIASHDQRSDRSDSREYDVADKVVRVLREELAVYRWDE